MGANAAHVGALSVNNATALVRSGNQSNVPYGFVRVKSKVTRRAFGESLGMGLHVGQTTGWTRGNVTGAGTANGYGGQQHIELVLSLGPFGASFAVARLQHFLDYAGSVRVETRGVALVPRLSFAVFDWLSVLAGAGPVIAGRVSVGRSTDESTLTTQLFDRTEAREIGSGSSGVGWQALVGIDASLVQIGLARFGLRTEAQLLRSGKASVAGSAPIGFDAKALTFALYVGWL